MPKIIRSAASKQRRQRESAVWLDIAKHIEQTGEVPGGLGICNAACEATGSISRTYPVVGACFGLGWPFGDYGNRKANEKRVIAATLLSLIVCTDQEPEPEAK